MTLTDAIKLLEAAGYVVRKKAPPKAQPLQFFAALEEAKRAAVSSLGKGWHLVPGHSHWITIPPATANYHFVRKDGSRSLLIHNPRDYRVPVAKYWPGGMIPPNATYEVPAG